MWLLLAMRRGCDPRANHTEACCRCTSFVRAPARLLRRTFRFAPEHETASADDETSFALDAICQLRNTAYHATSPLRPSPRDHPTSRQATSSQMGPHMFSLSLVTPPPGGTVCVRGGDEENRRRWHGEFGTLDRSDKTIAILGDRWWPQTARNRKGIR